MTKDDLDEATTVGKLIAVLRKWPKDMPVAIEGCDCIGAANGDVELDTLPAGDAKYVLIKRGPTT